jgi:hypothetical protein
LQEEVAFMVGKLMYSRVLQNRMLKNQASDQQPVAQKQPAQFYSGADESYAFDRQPYDRDERAPDPRSEGNKIRRGPGRRIDKEKRVRNMDPALMQKYASLPEALQEKINATIQICYQQHMNNVYKNLGKSDHNHYETEVHIDADGEIRETTTGLND